MLGVVEILKKSNGLQLLSITTLTVVLLVAQQFISLSSRTRLATAVVDSLHTPWFFSLYILMWLLLRHVLRMSFKQTLLLSGIASLGLAFGTESLQLFSSREASIGDAGRNLLGALSALLLILAAGRWKNSKPRLAIVLFTASAWVFASGFSVVVYNLWLNHQRAAIMPQLIDFNRPAVNAEIFRSEEWVLTAAELDWPGYENQRVAEITVSKQVSYPGISLRQPNPDWRGYDWLVLDSFISEDYSIPFIVRVETLHNRGTDGRHNLLMQPGVNQWRLPVSELIVDKSEGNSEILNVYIFTLPPEAGKRFYLGNIYLE